MVNSVKLDEIIDALEFQFDGNHVFLDKRIGEVVSVSDEEMQAAEDNELIEDFPDWQQSLVRIAKEIMHESGDYIRLPSKFDIDDYSIMERFCLSIEDSKISDTLYGLIKGSGAFRRFKDAIYEYDIADDWYKYRNNALKLIAVKWCKENNIEFDEQ
jgi:hypothetical protein